MKKMLAILSAAAMLFSFAACGGGAATTPDTTAAAEESVVSTAEAAESTTKAVATTREQGTGRLKEMDGFSVVTPDHWCQLTYKDDGYRLELYDTPSAPDIKKTTPMVKIQMEEGEATQENVDANVAALKLRPEAKQGTDKKIGGYTFAFQSYKQTVDKTSYFVYTGLVEKKLCTITLRGISPNDEDVTAILQSIKFNK